MRSEGRREGGREARVLLPWGQWGTGTCGGGREGSQGFLTLGQWGDRYVCRRGEGGVRDGGREGGRDASVLLSWGNGRERKDLGGQSVVRGAEGSICDIYFSLP